VVEVLVREHGIAADRLEAHGVGPLVPVATNHADSGRAKNRRVEPAVTQPAPPQTRTCPIKASGSSVQPEPHDDSGAELGYPSPVARPLLRRLVGSMSFPSVLPATCSAWLRLPSGGSLGLHFPTLSGTMLSYDCPLPFAGRFTCRSRPATLSASSVCVPLPVRWQPEALCHRQGS
jgi:hypothetical protein